VHFNLRDGSSALMTVFLMIIIIAVVSIGLIILTTTASNTAGNVSNSSLEGIVTSGEIYNATNSTMHGMSEVMPSFVWILFIFLVVVFLGLLVLGLGKRG
jgi:hypothetical protein